MQTVMTTKPPQRGPEVPLDRQVIEYLREKADKGLAEDMHGRVPYYMNWLWYARMVTTLEKGLAAQKRVVELEKRIKELENVPN